MTRDLKIGVVGAGVMGSGIAKVVASAGNETVCVDTSPQVLDRAQRSVLDGRYGLRRGQERGKLSADQVSAAQALLTVSSDLADAADVDLEIEAVFEDLALKQQLFRELDEVASPHTVLASSASGLSVTSVAYATGRPQRVIGWRHLCRFVRWRRSS